MPTQAPAFIKVIAESPTTNLDRFASERAIRMEWTVDESFVALCDRYGLARRGATAWSASGEDDNQNNLIAFVRACVNLYGPHSVQGNTYVPNEAHRGNDAIQGSVARVLMGSTAYRRHFDFLSYPLYGTPEYTKLGKSLSRIVIQRSRGGIWVRLATGHDNEQPEFDALTYPSMQGLTQAMKRRTFLTPLEAGETIRKWTRGQRANIDMADDVAEALDTVEQGVVVGYKTGAPALAVIRAGHKVKNAPTTKKDKAITLKRIVSMREKNPDVTFYVHPSLDDIMSMNAATPYEDERLRPYQREAVGLHLSTSIGYLQACDTGAGKTVMQLAAMRERSKGIENYRGLVVCEATMREQWEEEADVWFPEASLTFVKAAKDADKVADLLALEGPVVVVTSYAHVVSALEEAERRAAALDPSIELDDVDEADIDSVTIGALLLDTRWHDAAADEAVSIRNNASKQSKALWALRDNIDVATALTATPRNKSHDDIGHLLAWVRGDRHLFVGDTKLSLCYDEDDAADAQRLFETLGPLVFRRSAAEFSDELPDTNPIVEYLDPTPAEKMLAHAAENELKRIYFELVEALEHAERTKGADPEQLADARKALREAHGAWLGGTTLARMTMSDPVSILGSESVGAKLLIAQGLVQAAIDSNPSKRAKFLADVTERVARGEQVLVFTSYSTVANLLVQHLADIGISAAPFTGKNLSTRDNHRKAFQAGELDVLVATSAGTRGLTLTAATTVIHYDLPWTIEQVIQRTGRIVRFGSAHDSVDIVFYVLRETIEERIALHLIANGTAATLVLDTARGIDAAGSGTMQALGGLLEGSTKVRKAKKNAKGAVEFGKVVLGVGDEQIAA
jgi:superfamily II DNA or RNA helicase